MIAKTKYQIMVIGILSVVVIQLSSMSCRADSTDTPRAYRPAEWALPMALEGVPNLHKVTDSLYRSAQPTEEGFANLRKMGIRTVISLRAFHSDTDEIEDAGAEKYFKVERISFNTWHAEDEDVVRFLKLVTDPENAPVLVHCQHGADRTGLMNAIYRVSVQGWTKEAALQEMTEGGYGYHSIWKNLPEYFDELDIEKIRKEAGLAGELTAK